MRYFLLLIILAYQYNTAQAQGHNPTLAPEDTFSFIKIKLMNPNGSAYANSKVTVKGNKGYETVVQTDKNGRAKAKVPVSDTYSFLTGKNKEHTAFRKVTTSSFPYVTYNMQGYTRRFIYFTFRYYNLKGQPLKDEAVTVTSNTGKVYEGITNEKGQAIFELPFDKQFTVGVAYHPVATMLNPTDVNKEYKVMSADFSWIGTAVKKRREFVADSIARAYAEKMKIYMDSLEKVLAKRDSLRKTLKGKYGKDIDVTFFDKRIPLGCGSSSLIEQLLQQKAKLYTKALKEDPAFFEKENQAVLAPLYRLRKKFVNKIIVTDITGSMSPYMEQIMLWHALNFVESEGQGTKYLFFNDGNAKSTEQKVIGETGGFFYAEGRMKDFGSILHTMRKGMRYGGGDGPENDIEALLEATSKRAKNDEVILVADNYSTIRDIGLLSELKVPVRVIVCGVEEGGIFGVSDISEEYLDIARETGGSIHTVKEDIYDLAKVQEGNSITIHGVEYSLQHGRFVQKKRI